jgi:hypothetical protein
MHTELPDFTNLQDIEYNWEKSVYGNVTENLPTVAPIPLGKGVIQHSQFNANIKHFMLTGVL